MAKDSIEQGLSVLEAKKANLSPEQRERLAVLTSAGKDVRESVSDIFKTIRKRELSPVQKASLFSTLKARFSRKPEHYEQVEGVNFTEVKKALEASAEAMYSLAQMEKTEGLPDIVAVEDDAFVFGDCSAESPNRRDLTYDQAAKMAKKFGVKMMPVSVYKKMQEGGRFDLKTRSWLATSTDTIEDSFALIGERYHYFGPTLVYPRYAHTHDDGKGWRGMLRVPKAA